MQHLPANYTYQPPHLSSDEADQRWRLACEAQLSEQMSRYAIAPGASLQLPGRPQLKPGDPVTPDDVGGREHLKALEARGVILTLEGHDLDRRRGPEDVTHVWTGPTAIVTTHGIVAPGDGVGPTSFAQPPREAYQRARPNGQIVDVPGFEGVDGAKRLAELEAQGKARKLAKVEIAARKATL